MERLTDKRLCSALRKDGSQCHGWPDVSGLCPVHRPNAREIQVLGGKNRSRQLQLEHRLPSRLRPVLDMLGRAIVETHEGNLAPARAQAMASLASALIKLAEYAEMEIRLTTLEIKLKRGGTNGIS